MMQYAHIFPIVVALLGTLTGSAISQVFESRISRKDIGVWIAVAAGMMMGCGTVLTYEAIELNGYVLGISSVLLGMAFMKLVDYFSTQYLDVDKFCFSSLRGEKAIKLLVTLIGLVAHSIGEGLSLGISAAQRETLSSGTGFVVYVSLALHNIPEAAALALAFRNKGTTKLQAGILAIASTLPQSIVAVPAYSLFSMSYSAIVIGTGIASGCMFYAVLYDIYPEAVELMGNQKQTIVVTVVSTSLVILFDVYHHILIR